MGTQTATSSSQKRRAPRVQPGDPSRAYGNHQISDFPIIVTGAGAVFASLTSLFGVTGPALLIPAIIGCVVGFLASYLSSRP